MTRNPVFRVINVIMASCFLLSAVLQYNDPDPLRWIVIYGAAGAACLLFSRGARAWLLPAVVGLISLAWAGALAPSALPDLVLSDLVLPMDQKTPAIEEGREMLGLLIIALWMIVLTILARRNVSPLTESD